MKTFASIQKIDTGILYALELASSLSVLLLAFGLIASMTNVLTQGSVLTDNLTMQRVWAWTQCVAIDASVAGAIIRTVHYKQSGERGKMWLYIGLSALLLFTAMIVSNIEALQQTLNTTLSVAYGHVFIPVEALIWIRSIAIVLLIVAHATRHTDNHTDKHEQASSISEQDVQVILAKLSRLDTLEKALQTTITPVQEALTPIDVKASASPVNEPVVPNVGEQKDEQDSSYATRIEALYQQNKAITVTEIVDQVGCSRSTANKWLQRVKPSKEGNEQ